MHDRQEFDELKFFADVKKKPGVYYGNPSLLSLRDQLPGMEYASSFYADETPLRYFRAFVTWYQNEKVDDQNGYACLWNHLLYQMKDSTYYFAHIPVCLRCNASSFSAYLA